MTGTCEINVEPFPDKQIMFAVYEGTLTLSGAQKLMDAVRNHPNFNPTYFRLYDLSKAKIDWSLEDIKQLVQYIYSVFSNTKFPMKIAIITKDSVEEALMQLFVSVSKMQLDREFRLFFDRESAESWLASTD